jgi:uncharacterized membrane protein YphA (DoxX/SURF4 family)
MNEVKLILLFITFASFILIFLLISMHNALATSPQFVRQEIIDNKSDWVHIISGSQDWLDIANQSKATKGDPLADITKIYYLNDGKFLNATLRLSPLAKISVPAIMRKQISYGILVDIDNDFTTGINGIDYRIAFNYNNTSNKWISRIQEIETPDPNTGIAGKRLFSPLPFNVTDEKGIIKLSLNLQAIGSPTNYNMIFYTLQKEQDGNIWDVDFSGRVFIPPPEYTLYTIPNPIQVREGKNDPISVQLRSSQGSVGVYNYTVQDKPGILSNFTFEMSKSANVPQLKSIRLDIDVAKNTNPGLYSVPILINSSSESGFAFPFYNRTSNSYVKPFTFDKGYVTKELSLPITILKPISFQEQLSIFNEEWITPLNGIYGFIGGIAIAVITWAYHRIDEKSKLKRAMVNLRKWLKLYIPPIIRLAASIILFTYLIPKLAVINQLSNWLIPELLFAILIFIGLATRIAAILCISLGIAIAVFVLPSSSNIFMIPGLGLAVILIVLGPGRISIEWEVLKREIFPKVKTQGLIDPNQHLTVSLTLLAKSFNVGASLYQQITVVVTDPNNKDGNKEKPVSKAIVEGEINGPPGYSKKLEPEITDENGVLTYNWEMGPNSKAGLYEVTIKVYGERDSRGCAKVTYQGN